MQAQKKAVVLLSGGLDSTTTLAIAKGQTQDVYALTFRYGQRHVAEIEAARKIAAEFEVAEHIIVEMDLHLFEDPVPPSNLSVCAARGIGALSGRIPITHVPARNTIFLSFALAWAEVLGAEDIFLGVNAADFGGNPDSRPEYIEAYQHMANLATKAGAEGRQHLTIRTPLIFLTKSEIIQKGLRLGVDYGMTLSCHDPSPAGEACGVCDACRSRLNAFEHIGVVDPAPYQTAERIVA